MLAGMKSAAPVYGPLTEQQTRAMDEFLAAKADVQSAKNSRIKYEIRLARERLAAAKKAAKKLGCTLPIKPKKPKLSLIAGGLSRTFG